MFDRTLYTDDLQDPLFAKKNQTNRSGTVQEKTKDDGCELTARTHCLVPHELQSPQSRTFLPTRIHHLEILQTHSHYFKTDLKTFFTL